MQHTSYFTALRYLAAIAMFVLPSIAVAHVSEQGLVLLLPTDFYITSGVLVVILTLVMVLLIPASTSVRLFNSTRLFTQQEVYKPWLQTASSLLSFSLLLFLLLLGITGTRDPLENLLPLFIWTVWWIALPIAQGLIGDIWQWLNPWIGIYRLATRAGWCKYFNLPEKTGCWPGIFLFLLFTSFALADVAPDVPRRLALFVGGYWCCTMALVLLFGEQWLKAGECFSMLFCRYSQIAPVALAEPAENYSVSHRQSLRPQSLNLGLPGWQLLKHRTTSFSAAIFVLILLGCGSFDGLNETFSWLAMIGVNPLEFPGRSAIIKETTFGLLAVNVALIVIYAACIFAGLFVCNRQIDVKSRVSFKTAFCALAVSVLPIAFAYHFAHFLVTLLVDGQYVIAALSDPLSNGADYLNVGSYYVSTGFMNTPASVKTIWLTQAAAVVAGHVVSVLLAHAIAVELFGNARRAIVSQAPLAMFMVGYTFVGLWLLAAPKGA